MQTCSSIVVLENLLQMDQKKFFFKVIRAEIQGGNPTVRSRPQKLRKKHKFGLCRQLELTPFRKAVRWVQSHRQSNLFAFERTIYSEEYLNASLGDTEATMATSHVAYLNECLCAAESTAPS